MTFHEPALVESVVRLLYIEEGPALVQMPSVSTDR